MLQKYCKQTCTCNLEQIQGESTKSNKIKVLHISVGDTPVNTRDIIEFSYSVKVKLNLRSKETFYLENVTTVLKSTHIGCQ